MILQKHHLLILGQSIIFCILLLQINGQNSTLTNGNTTLSKDDINLEKELFGSMTIEEIQDGINNLYNARLKSDNLLKNDPLVMLAEEISSSERDNIACFTNSVRESDFFYENRSDFARDINFSPSIFNCGTQFDVVKLLNLVRKYSNKTQFGEHCTAGEKVIDGKNDQYDGDSEKYHNQTAKNYLIHHLEDQQKITQKNVSGNIYLSPGLFQSVPQAVHIPLKTANEILNLSRNNQPSAQSFSNPKYENKDLNNLQQKQLKHDQLQQLKLPQHLSLPQQQIREAEILPQMRSVIQKETLKNTIQPSQLKQVQQQKGLQIPRNITLDKQNNLQVIHLNNKLENKKNLISNTLAVPSSPSIQTKINNALDTKYNELSKSVNTLMQAQHSKMVNQNEVIKNGPHGGIRRPIVYVGNSGNKKDVNKMEINEYLTRIPNMENVHHKMVSLKPQRLANLKT